MIVTVTPNTAIDHTVFISSYAPGKTIRSERSNVSMAGKAADASWVLSELGIPSLALGFAAGGFGRIMETMLRERGIMTDFTWVEGETRLNTVIVTGDCPFQTTLTTDTLNVRPEHLESLLKTYRASLERADCVVLGGRWPPGIDPGAYVGMIQSARKRLIPVILDASGSALLAGLRGSPTFIKPNRDEMEGLAGHALLTLTHVYHAACDVQSVYGCSVVVTLGHEGALAVLPGRAYLIPPLNVKVVNAAGAGDAVVAGLAAALSQKKSYEEGLRLGFAAAAAVLLTEGTAWCRRTDIERLYPDSQLVPYP